MPKVVTIDSHAQLRLMRFGARRQLLIRQLARSASSQQALGEVDLAKLPGTVRSVCSGLHRFVCLALRTPLR